MLHLCAARGLNRQVGVPDSGEFHAAHIAADLAPPTREALKPQASKSSVD